MPVVGACRATNHLKYCPAGSAAVSLAYSGGRPAQSCRASAKKSAATAEGKQRRGRAITKGCEWQQQCMVQGARCKVQGARCKVQGADSGGLWLTSCSGQVRARDKGRQEEGKEGLGWSRHEANKDGWELAILILATTIRALEQM